ncbi:hypothetical protein [Paenibacillus tianjinensis]|uniref:Uncharacterized protein n=1 Tax=Paenibacillus tianjinensis TaxID=2810347 RepID=A0ABX7L4A4_9BACL|nr:hypothetical protein [Paenibacillus tianjinensis]QSF42702.1 hypothetical protein JRJ22_15410 [Paenibacillus tianjinensis]
MEFDALRAARTRLCELRNIHQELSKTQQPDGTWDWFLVNEMRELSMAIINEKEKARLAGRTGLSTPLKRLVMPIVPLKFIESKGEAV